MERRAQDNGSGLLSLHQIQTVHSCNEYIESPSTWPHPQISGPDEDPVASPDDNTQDSLHSPQSAQGSTDTGLSSEQGMVENKGETVVKEQPEKFELELQRGLIVISAETAVEEQSGSFELKTEVSELGEGFIPEQKGLTESVGKLHDAVQEQPKSCNLKPEELNLLGNTAAEHRNVNLEPKEKATKHPSPCDRCSRCKCKDCTIATTLPACWICGHRCLCSAEALVEYTTCACCLKALLYHCSSDDEDSSADAPFSCQKSRRCTRWSTAVAMAFVLPCLLCYIPARGCLALCQLCHDHTHRTGCRCERQHLTHVL